MSQHKDSEPSGVLIHLTPNECFRLLNNSRPGKERQEEMDRILKSQIYSFATKYIVSKVKDLFPYWCENGKVPLTMKEYSAVCKANGIQVMRRPRKEPSTVGVLP